MALTEFERKMLTLEKEKVGYLRRIALALERQGQPKSLNDVIFQALTEEEKED